MHSGIEVVLGAERIGSVFGFPITNSLLMTWVVMVLLIGFAYFFGKNLKLVPGKFQAGFEMVYTMVLDYMAETFENRALAEKFFPLVATIFLFIFIGNELAFIPGVGSIGFFHEEGFAPLLRAPSADLNFTLALAIISFCTIEITGMMTLGFLKYGSKFVNLKSPIGFIVGLIEMVSNLGRLISFSFRLFGNIFAGEVMILVAMYFFPLFLPVPLMAFEVFVGMIQAVVFAMLTLFFIKLAIAEPEEGH